MRARKKGEPSRHAKNTAGVQSKKGRRQAVDRQFTNLSVLDYADNSFSQVLNTNEHKHTCVRRYLQLTTGEWGDAKVFAANENSKANSAFNIKLREKYKKFHAADFNIHAELDTYIYKWLRVIKRA